MSETSNDIIELSNGLRLELMRSHNDRADFPWGRNGEQIQDMNKILETDTSVKLYQKADIITKDGVKVPLFPTEKDKETAAELGSESMKGFIVKIDKDKNQIHKESVYWAYGDEVIAKSLIDVKEKDNKVEVHEVELNDYYKHRRAFDNTYINGERNGKESEYDILSNDNRKKVRETQWKNNQKDGTEVFFTAMV